MLETYLNLLEMGYYEVKFAFEGLADANVWKRPAAGLLSVGELAGHIAYWEAIRMAGEGEELAKCRVSSPLIDQRFRYLSTTLATPPSEQHLTMTAEQVCGELLRVHEESVAHFKALNPDLDTHIPGCPTGFTYVEYLKYAVFHVSLSHRTDVFGAPSFRGGDAGQLRFAPLTKTKNSGSPLGSIVGREAMEFGWQRLNAEYARQFRIATPDGPPEAAQKRRSHEPE